MARTQEGLPAWLRTDLVRKTGQGQGSASSNEGKREGDQGGAGGGAKGTTYRQHGIEMKTTFEKLTILLGAQAKVARIKERRVAKEEKDRYAKLAEKMHKKRVERLKRKEKRNKLINS